MKGKSTTLDQILRDPKRRRAWVIYQLQLQGKNLSQIARNEKVARQTVYKAFEMPYPKMEKAIADALGMLPGELFPDRYTDGIPNRIMAKSSQPKPKKQ